MMIQCNKLFEKKNVNKNRNKIKNHKKKIENVNFMIRWRFLFLINIQYSDELLCVYSLALKIVFFFLLFKILISLRNYCVSNRNF